MSWSSDPWWARARDERYRIVLLNQQEATIKPELDGVSGGVIDIGVGNDIRAAGNLDLTLKKLDPALDWATVRIRPEYVVKWQGVERAYPLGVYIPSAPKIGWGGTSKTVDLEFYDKTIILKQDALGTSKSFRKNSKMNDALKWVSDSIGEKRYIIDPSTKKFSKNQVFTVGTTKLDIVRKVLEMLDYFAIWCDGNGYYRCHAYKLPSQRPILYRFEAGDKSIHRADWELDQDGYEVPNRVVCIPSTGSKRGVAEDKTSRWGYESRGKRWITRVEEGVEEKTTAALNKKAKELLASSQDVHDKVTLDHAYLPLEMNDLVTFASQGYGGRFALRKTSINLSATVLVQSELEGVTT